MTLSYRLYALVGIVLSFFALSTLPAYANHPTHDESATPSQAETAEDAHDDTDDHHTAVPVAVTISAPASTTAQLQQLLAAMMQLVELLQKQQEIIEHDATPHTHDDADDHDDEDNHAN